MGRLGRYSVCRSVGRLTCVICFRDPTCCPRTHTLLDIAGHWRPMLIPIGSLPNHMHMCVHAPVSHGSSTICYHLQTHFELHLILLFKYFPMVQIINA